MVREEDAVPEDDSAGQTRVMPISRLETEVNGGKKAGEL